MTDDYEILVVWSDEDAAFVAEVPELPGCMAHGDQPDQALAKGREAIALWIEMAGEVGRVVPSPKAGASNSLDPAIPPGLPDRGMGDRKAGMNEPTFQSPQPEAGQPSPFEPRQVKPAVSAGCGKPLAIGCSLFVVLFLVTSVIFMVKMYDVLAWTVDKMVLSVEDYPQADDVTAADKEELDKARRAAVAKIRTKNIDPAALQRMQSRFMGLAGTTEVTHEDYVELTEALRRLAGSEAPGDDGAPADDPPADGGDSPSSGAAPSGTIADAGADVAEARRR